MPSRVEDQDQSTDGCKKKCHDPKEDAIAKVKNSPFKVGESKRKNNDIANFSNKRKRINATSKSSQLQLTIPLEPTTLTVTQMEKL